MKNKPPYHITHSIVNLLGQIGRELGRISGAKLSAVPVRLRRENAIKSIQSSLAIEGNTLTLEQVSAIFDGKHVLAPRKDILEVQNAIAVYHQLADFNPLSISDFKKAHKLLMRDLVDKPGVWRMTGVAVYSGKEVVHMAPAAKMVPGLMEALFEFVKKEKNVSWLIRACVFHYELEFIHPFVDGNGRMGRLWQQRLLMQEDEIFEFLSVESLIKDNQERYYQVLAECDQAGDSTAFIEFSLEHILNALQLYTQSVVAPVQDFRSRLQLFQKEKPSGWFTRKEYLLFHKDISTATASRDLITGAEEGLLIKRGQKNQVEYHFAR